MVAVGIERVALHAVGIIIRIEITVLFAEHFVALSENGIPEKRVFGDNNMDLHGRHL